MISPQKTYVFILNNLSACWINRVFHHQGIVFLEPCMVLLLLSLVCYASTETFQPFAWRNLWIRLSRKGNLFLLWEGNLTHSFSLTAVLMNINVQFSQTHKWSTNTQKRWYVQTISDPGAGLSTLNMSVCNWHSPLNSYITRIWKNWNIWSKENMRGIFFLKRLASNSWGYCALVIGQPPSSYIYN